MGSWMDVPDDLREFTLLDLLEETEARCGRPFPPVPEFVLLLLVPVVLYDCRGLTNGLAVATVGSSLRFPFLSSLNHSLNAVKRFARFLLAPPPALLVLAPRLRFFIVGSISSEGLAGVGAVA